jgi:acetate kinase
MSGMETPRIVLALNSGSSSLKFGVYRVTSADTEELLSKTIDAPEPKAAIAKMADILAQGGLPPPDAVGHRIVHGGAKLRRHCPIDDAVMRDLEAAVAFAPLHMPPALAIIRFARSHYPHLPQIACFDTTFHADLPDVARVLPLPKDMLSGGVQRYGFHGLSCESIVHQLADDLPDRLVVAHLGNGASVTAIRRGKSIDTSMGLTPTGGVIMGTRSGDIDPGVLVYLMRARKLDATALEDLVNRRSGLLGISGIASDMRRLHEAAAASPDAALAIDMFCYSVRKQIAAMMAALGGADLVVFTGGIGENDGEVRDRICDGLSWTAAGIRVLPSQEDAQIARHAAVISRQPPRA